MSRTSPLAGERRLDNKHSENSGQYISKQRYFVGIDQLSTFRERIQEIYGDNPEITGAVSQLDEYFNCRSFEDLPEVQKFVGRVRRSIESPLRADEIASELIDQGYITALKRLGYSDGMNVTSTVVRTQRFLWMRPFRNQWAWRNPVLPPSSHEESSNMHAAYSLLMAKCPIL